MTDDSFYARQEPPPRPPLPRTTVGMAAAVAGIRSAADYLEDLYVRYPSTTRIHPTQLLREYADLVERLNGRAE
mgnify:CR=1 FL=1